MAMKITLLFVLLIASMPEPAAAQTFAIDTGHSSITVRVYKAGLLSVFAHDHEIRAAISAGSVTLSPGPAVEFSVPTSKMVVLDPELDSDKREEVQSTMLGPKVLDSKRYPEIHFRSTRAENSGGGKWSVEGELTIRGQTRPVRVTAEEGGDGRYRGTVKIKQRDFGIQPISLAGGTIKVKDEIRIEFEIVPQVRSTNAVTGLDTSAGSQTACQAERREPSGAVDRDSAADTVETGFLLELPSYAFISSSKA
jgi:polyisoprenoid-binding protein YceI